MTLIRIFSLVMFTVVLGQCADSNNYQRNSSTYTSSYQQPACDAACKERKCTAAYNNKRAEVKSYVNKIEKEYKSGGYCKTPTYENINLYLSDCGTTLNVNLAFDCSASLKDTDKVNKGFVYRPVWNQKECKMGCDWLCYDKDKCGSYTEQITSWFDGWWNSEETKKSKPKYTNNQKRVIETCDLYSNKFYNVKFKGTPESCYRFLNVYREGANDQVDRLYDILKDAYTYSNMSSSKIITLGTAVKNQMQKYDCRFQRFRAPDTAEEIIPCMEKIITAPKALIGYIEITNDYNRTQTAKSTARNMQKTTGDKLIEMGLHLSSIGTKKSSSGTSNSHTGFTKVCIKDGIGGKKSVTVGAVELCPIGYKELK